MAEYDGLAQSYREAKKAPFRAQMEMPTFRQVAGSVENLTVLDLACGEGHYTRVLAQMGAARVVGCDISEDMIQTARKTEEENPLGITYHCCSAEDLGEVGPFDLVTAAYLLNCAPTLDSLRGMWRSIATSLSNGGRFGGIYGTLDRALNADLSPYGIRTYHTAPLEDGEAYRFDLWNGSGWLELVNYAWRLETVERLAHEAGMRDLTWCDAVCIDGAQAPSSPILVGITAEC